jgi:hypothetical protein
MDYLLKRKPTRLGPEWMVGVGGVRIVLNFMTKS